MKFEAVGVPLLSNMTGLFHPGEGACQTNLVKKLALELLALHRAGLLKVTRTDLFVILPFAGPYRKVQPIFPPRDRARVSIVVGAVRIVGLIQIDGVQMGRIGMLTLEINVPTDLI